MMPLETTVVTGSHFVNGNIHSTKYLIGLQIYSLNNCVPWWRHQMETFSVSLAFCAGNSPVIDEFPSERTVTRKFDVFFDLCLNQQALSFVDFALDIIKMMRQSNITSTRHILWHNWTTWCFYPSRSFNCLRILLVLRNGWVHSCQQHETYRQWPNKTRNALLNVFYGIIT